MENDILRLAHITDTHIRRDYSGNSMEYIFAKVEDPIAKFRQLLEKSLAEKADCILISGDIVHEGDAEDYACVRETVEQVVGARAKVLYVCGNHDRKQAMREGLRLTVGDSIDYVEYVKDYRIVVLDSAVEGKENGQISMDQENWLSDVLRQKYGKGTILTFHHPVVWDVPHIQMNVSEEFATLIAGSDVIGIFCGHTHSNNIQSWNNTTQYTADAMAFGMEMSGDKFLFVEKAGMSFYNVQGRNVSTHVESVETKQKVLAEIDAKEMLQLMK